MHLVSNSRQPNLPCPLFVLPDLLHAMWFLPLATVAPRSPGSSCKESESWSDELLGGGRDGEGTSGRTFWSYRECIHISISVWKIFCSADPFLEACIVIVCAAARGGPSGSTLHQCCMFSLLPKCVLVLLDISKPSLSLWTLTSNRGEFSNECS